MLIVITSNIVKGTAMLLVLMDECPDYLVTSGDAVVYFLKKADPVTIGLRTLFKDDMPIKFGLKQPSAISHRKRKRKEAR
jgi:hypothetical protein